jgi:toxin FitB
MSFLLDTNVVSELRRRTPSPNVLQWFETVAAHEIHISVLTIGEIRQGIELLRRKDPIAAASIEGWLLGLVTTYRDRIVDVDASIAETWGRLNVPDPVPTIDGLLAATALVNGWTLVTRNVGDVERTGVRILNPFDESPTAE